MTLSTTRYAVHTSRGPSARPPTHSHTHAQSHTCTHVCTHMHVCTNTHATHTRTRTHTHAPHTHMPPGRADRLARACAQAPLHRALHVPQPRRREVVPASGAVHALWAARAHHRAPGWVVVCFVCLHSFFGVCAGLQLALPVRCTTEPVGGCWAVSPCAAPRPHRPVRNSELGPHFFSSHAPLCSLQARTAP